MLTPSLFNENFDLIDRLCDDPWFGFNDREFKNLEKKIYGHRAKNVMNTDIREKDDGYEMEIDLPGFKKDEISVELNDGYLTISASKSYDYDTSDDDSKKDRYIRKERYSGSCSRSFYVGDAITHDDVKANFEHGILTLHVPKKEVKQLEENRYIAIEG